MIERCRFEWRLPVVNTYRAAPPKRYRFLLNRYPGIVIGVAVQVRSRVFGLRWGRPGALIEGSPSDA